MKVYLSVSCFNCEKPLYFDSISSLNKKNYIFFKGKYFCKNCFKKRNNLNIRTILI